MNLKNLFLKLYIRLLVKERFYKRRTKFLYPPISKEFENKICDLIFMDTLEIGRIIVTFTMRLNTPDLNQM